MKLVYENEKIKDEKKPFNHAEIYKKLEELGSTNTTIKRTDKLEIDIDVDITSEQKIELQEFLKDYDITKTEVYKAIQEVEEQL